MRRLMGQHRVGTGLMLQVVKTGQRSDYAAEVWMARDVGNQFAAGINLAAIAQTFNILPSGSSTHEIDLPKIPQSPVAWPDRDVESMRRRCKGSTSLPIAQIPARSS